EATLATTKEARELIDKQWEETQAPLRVRIAGLADEAIRETWGKGKKVTRDNCAKFAVDVLCYIRKRFYAEVAEKAAAAHSVGREVPVDPPYQGTLCAGSPQSWVQHQSGCCPGPRSAHRVSNNFTLSEMRELTA
ncbi:hypothetical protein KEM56_006174, partial [Ascosphaera pollenicola]